jgi:iron complex transport system substrate-binding protein
MRAILLSPLLLLIGAAPPPPPQRIVSLNMCADQLLLALADRSQIAAITRLSRDPDMSAVAAEARTMPVVRGSAEDVLALRADLVVATSGRRQMVMAALGDPPIATLDLDPANSYPEILQQIRAVAAAVGHRDRGEALIARMNAALATVPRNAGRGRVAAYYQRRGFLTGTGTLIDDMMRRLGLTNLATRLNKPPLAQMSLEEMAVARPDYLIVETETDRVADQGTEMLHHPLLANIPRLRIPQAWTVCGSPFYIHAIRSLADQMR